MANSPDQRRYQYHIEVNLNDSRAPGKRIHDWLALSAQWAGGPLLASNDGHETTGTSSTHFFSARKIRPVTIQRHLDVLNLRTVAYRRVDLTTGTKVEFYPMGRQRSREADFEF